MPLQSSLQAVASFGQFVLTNQEQITRRWVTVVDRSPEVASSDALTYHQVLDHLPPLCTELGMLLKQPNASGIRERASRDAGRHGQKRWQQGYKLDELLREICLIRSELLGNWFNVFARSEDGFDMSARDSAREIVQRFFDDVIIDSTVQFVQEQTEFIQQVRSQLAEAESAAQKSKSEVLRHVSHSLREPLGAIGFAAEALSEETGLSGQAQANVRSILRNVKLEAQHIDELLLAAELSGPRQNNVNVNERG